MISLLIFLIGLELCGYDYIYWGEKSDFCFVAKNSHFSHIIYKTTIVDF